MAHLQAFRWASRAEGSTRRERSGCSYDAYIPDPLMGRKWSFDGDVAADVADAEADIARFDERVSALSDTEGLARLLLRAEAVASSRIEGLEAGPRRVLRAEAAHRMGVASLDVGADEILGNIHAMQVAIVLALKDVRVQPETLLSIHAELFRNTRLAAHAGKLRTEQNWIGGNGYNPCSAAYVPPPAELVPELVADLCEFCSMDDLPPLAQAAIAHAQFETIHPFVDGNGRAGRALIHLVLRRRGLARRFVPPLSLVLATWSDRYIGGLTAFRHLGEPDSGEGRAAVNQWVATCAAATRRSVADAQRHEDAVTAIVDSWRQKLGRMRRDSAAALLVAALPAVPIITVASAAQLVGRSFEATNQAVARLKEAGVLHPVTVGRRNRAFEATTIIDSLTDLERRIGSPDGDTRTAPPSRPFPGRRQHTRNH